MGTISLSSGQAERLQEKQAPASEFKARKGASSKRTTSGREVPNRLSAESEAATDTPASPVRPEPEDARYSAYRPVA